MLLRIGQIGIVDLLLRAGFASSRSDARRLVRAGAVDLDGRRIKDPRDAVLVCDEQLLRVGKRRIGRIQLV